MLWAFPREWNLLMSCFFTAIPAAGITKESLLQIPPWSLLQADGTFGSWGWRWDPALELELGCIPGVGSFLACALLNIFIIFNSHFPSCILVAPALRRDGDPANASDHWGHHAGVGEGGCDPCGNHRWFRCVYEPGHNFLCPSFSEKGSSSPQAPRMCNGQRGQHRG